LRHKGIAKQSKEKGDKGVFSAGTNGVADFGIFDFEIYYKSAIPEISKSPNI